MKRRSRLATAALATTALAVACLLIFLGLGLGHVAPGAGQGALAAAGFSVYAFEATALLWLATAARALWRRIGRSLRA